MQAPDDIDSDGIGERWPISISTTTMENLRREWWLNKDKGSILSLGFLALSASDTIIIEILERSIFRVIITLH